MMPVKSNLCEVQLSLNIKSLVTTAYMAFSWYKFKYKSEDIKLCKDSGMQNNIKNSDFGVTLSVGYRRESES